MILQGKSWKFGDNISTDHIAPGRLFHLRSNLPELAKHVLEDADPEFAQKVQPGDFVVGGNNFGLGSSREHAVITLLEGGVGGIIAQSFGRIFYRNAINRGLPVIPFPEKLDLQNGELVTIDLEQGSIIVGDEQYRFKPYPPEIRAIIDAGGIIPVMRQELKS